jgi:N6-adenosine-specific RNA methylase IME4
MGRWGFEFKSVAFSWFKGEGLPMFPDDVHVPIGCGYWTRAGFEQCWLATRGKPKRSNADVRQVLIEKRREHSRKPDGIHERIERLVAGPYLELFARQRRPGWDCWGNETDKFGDYDGQKDGRDSYYEGLSAIKERMAAGGPGWEPK